MKELNVNCDGLSLCIKSLLWNFKEINWKRKCMYKLMIEKWPAGMWSTEDFLASIKGIIKNTLTCSCRWFAAASCVAWLGGCKLRRSSSGSGRSPPSSSWPAVRWPQSAPCLLEGRLSGLASCDPTPHPDSSVGQNAHPCCHSDRHNDPWAEQREGGKAKTSKTNVVSF